MGTVSQLATAVEDDEVVFRLSDPDHEHDDVKVWFDVELGRRARHGRRSTGGWELRLAAARPRLPGVPLRRRRRHGRPTRATPTGSRVRSARTRGSRCPATSRRPGSTADAAPGRAAPADRRRDRRRGLGAGRSRGRPLPLLLVHDGAEMDAYGGVVRYAATRPPMRVGAAEPGQRPRRAVRRQPGVRRRAGRRGAAGDHRRLRDHATGRCCSARASARWRPCTRRGRRRAPSPG